jgi:hypothetical protein
MRNVANYSLWYKDLLVGTVSEAFYSDGTWFASFQRTIAPEANDLARRLHDYILFCMQWHARPQGCVTDPPEASEFDKYSDIIESGLWTVEAPDGGRFRITQAPVFMFEAEISWRED